MDRLASIVVGIDFSASSATALAQGIRIAAWNRAQLHAVHIVDTLVAVELTRALTPMVKGIEDSLIAEATKRWVSFAPNAAGVQFETRVNNEALGVLAAVQDHRADLLILGVGETAEHAGVGTLAARCVRRALCRVMLVRGSHAGPFKHVVACVDFSETSGRALEAAMRVAVQDGGKLTVLHAYRAPWKQFRLGAGVVAPGFEAGFVDDLRRRLNEFLGPLSAERQWLKPEVHLVETDNHGAAIVDFSRREGADLVVLGTRGQGNLREFLMGSTAERVVRDAPCSVLAVKPES